MRSARYGAKLRKLYDEVKKAKKTLYTCPKCGKEKVKRRGFAKWECKSCKSIIAGGAYTLTTTAGEISYRILAEQSGKGEKNA